MAVGDIQYYASNGLESIAIVSSERIALLQLSAFVPVTVTTVYLMLFNYTGVGPGAQRFQCIPMAAGAWQQWRPYDPGLKSVNGLTWALSDTPAVYTPSAVQGWFQCQYRLQS